MQVLSLKCVHNKENVSKLIKNKTKKTLKRLQSNFKKAKSLEEMWFRRFIIIIKNYKYFNKFRKHAPVACTLIKIIVWRRIKSEMEKIEHLKETEKDCN